MAGVAKKKKKSSAAGIEDATNGGSVSVVEFLLHSSGSRGAENAVGSFFGSCSDSPAEASEIAAEIVGESQHGSLQDCL
jgi:hypothetical protein